MALHPLEFLPELALGVLPDAEEADVRAHLATCSVCTTEFHEMDRVAGLLPFSVEDAAPSPELKAGLMERIAHEPRQLGRLARPTAAQRWPRWQWFSAAAAGVGVLLIAGLAGFLIGNGGGNNANSLLKANNLRQAALVQSVANGTVATTTAKQGGATATLLRAPGSSDAYAWLEGLPALPSGKAYEAWLTPDGKQFEPSTVFSNGEGVWLIGSRDFGTYTAVALTIEDSGGAKQPTQAPFLEVTLRGQAAGVPEGTTS